MWEYSNGGFKYIIYIFFLEKKYIIEFFVCVLISITVYLKKKQECLSYIGCMCLVPGYVMYYELGLYYFHVYSNKCYCLIKKKKKSKFNQKTYIRRMMCKMVRPQNLAKYYEVNQKLNFFDYIYIYIL